MRRNDVWRQYLTIQRGEMLPPGFLESSTIEPNPEQSRNRCQCGSNLILVNSGRLDEIRRACDAVTNKNTLPGLSYNTTKTSIFDVSLCSKWANGNTLRGAVRRWILAHPVAFAMGVLRHGSLGGGLIELLRRRIRHDNIIALELFTSNNRITECFRIAAIAEGIDVTEFLHGVCSNSFGQYYQIIERAASRSGSRLGYINMLPMLPQPLAVVRRLIKKNGKEVFFRNEKLWDPFDLSRRHDVLIVGGTAPVGNYLECSAFKDEIDIAVFCQKKGLSVVYCPHPAHAKTVSGYLPAGVSIGTVAQFSNSAKIMVGHYSTVLFAARILGHKVLIVPDAWHAIPSNLAALFGDREASTYTPELLVESLLEFTVEPRYGGTVVADGFDLDGLQHP